MTEMAINLGDQIQQCRTGAQEYPQAYHRTVAQGRLRSRLDRRDWIVLDPDITGTFAGLEKPCE